MNILFELEDIRENLNPELNQDSFNYFDNLIKSEFQKMEIDDQNFLDLQKDTENQLPF